MILIGREEEIQNNVDQITNMLSEEIRAGALDIPWIWK